MHFLYSRVSTGLLALAGLALAAPAAAQTTQSFPAVADAYVLAGSTQTNYNSEARLSLKRGTSTPVLRNAYVRFSTAGLTLSNVGSAKLKLYCYKQEKTNAPTDITAYATTDAWQESTITYANAPALGTNLGRATAQVGSYLELDVTSYVQGRLAAGTAVSFGLADAQGANNLNEFYSREAPANQPILELSTTTTPPPASTLTGTYYVDATGGSDTNPGLSPTTAWRTLTKAGAGTYGPGARLLFRAGQRFSGTLTLRGSGSATSPIVVDRYDSGAKPALDGGGATATLRLDNQQYWEINNLEITNFDAAEEGGQTLDQWEANNISQWANATQPQPQYLAPRTLKTGLLVTAQDVGAVNHLHFTGLEVHGVNGFVDQDDESSKNNGGMYFNIGGSTVPTYFDDLLIEGCSVHDVDRTGISNRSSWSTRTLTSGPSWTPSQRLVIRNNVFERTAANALIVRDARRPLMEHNLFDHCAVKISGNAGFNFDTDGAIWQFNEARFTRANVGDGDAGGLDSDYKTKGTILQYNYLHDNDYGILITGGPGAFNDSTVFRYNVMERDGRVPQNANDGKYLIKVSGTATNTVVHNNVFYVDSTQTGTKLTLHKLWTDWPDQTSYYNNLYYLGGPQPTTDLGSSTNNLFSHNLYYGSPLVNQPVDLYAVRGNPEVVAPGTGPAGYRLRAASAAIAKGQLLPSTPALDYFQGPINQANAVDIGVEQFSSVPPATSSTTLVTQQVYGAADAHVQGGASAGNNYGTAATLLTKNTASSPDLTRETYIRYDLSGVTGNVVSVQLVVNAALNPSGPMPVSVFKVADDSWQENALNWNNRPARGAYLATITGTTAASRQYAVDITDYALSQLRGDKTLSLNLADTTASTKLATIVSREGGLLQHYLLVTTQGSVTAPSVPAAKFDIYLLIGQSNMAGRGDIGAADRDTLRNVLLFNGNGWERAANPVNKYSTVRESLAAQQMGPGYTFGRKLAALTGQTIGLVVNARGSTSISQWQKGYSGANDFNLYEEAVAQLRKVQAQGTFKGIIWHQGESDQSNASAYLAKFQQLVANLRQDLGAGVPVVAGELGKWRTSSVDMNAVIRSIPAQVTNGYYVTADGLTPINGDVTDPHFDGPSQRVLGERYADRVAAAVYGIAPTTAWNGSLSTSWSAAGNWSPPTVPADTAAVLIADGAPRYPALTATDLAAARRLQLNRGASLAQQGGELRVTADWVNNGRYVASGGTVFLGNNAAGSSAATLAGDSLSTFWNLTVAPGGLRQEPAPASAGLAVRRLLLLRGDLTTQGNALTLRSDAAGTAMLTQESGQVRGRLTVQRYLSPALNAGPGYRHLASPVAGMTVGGLATAGFAPVVNAAYNTSPAPGSVQPFPTVLGYDQSRIATVASNYGAFDKGWYSPAALTAAMPSGQGYTVHVPGGLTVAFQGTAFSGNLTLPLAQGTDLEAGWQLVGNPYPAPLAYNRVAPADRPGLDAAIYVYNSTGPYAGQYRSYANGEGDSLIASGQAFFVRVSRGQTSGALTFRDAQRRTGYTDGQLLRTTTTTRPRVQLALASATLTDELTVYAEAGATTAFDAQLDAAKLLNPTGLNLAALSTDGRILAIDGRPALLTGTVVPLSVGVPAPGAYAFTVNALDNLPAGLTPYLRDALTGTRTALAAGTRYACTLAGTTAPGRFFLECSAATPLASASAALAEQVLAYPVPTRGQLTVLRPAGVPATTATLRNALGQVVRTMKLPTAETTVDLAGLAPGVYTLHLTLAGQPLARRVVLE